jgi:AcrR family transcriptional regulator
VASKPDDTPSRLILAAGEVFAEKGFEAASVREICSRAGTSLASIGYHFRDKEGLYTEVVKAAACSPRADQDLEWPPGTTPERKIRELIRARLTAMLSSNLPRWADQVMVRAMAEPTQATSDFIVQSIRPKFEQLFSVLAELLPPDTSPRDLHLAGISIFAQCMHYRILAPVTRLIVGDEEYGSYTVDRLTEHIAGFSLAALGHRFVPGEADKPAAEALALTVSQQSRGPVPVEPVEEGAVE